MNSSEVSRQSQANCCQVSHAGVDRQKGDDCSRMELALAKLGESARVYRVITVGLLDWHASLSWDTPG